MADRIIVLSLSDRVAPYQEALASFELEVEYLDNVMEVFRSCVRRPPGALIVDMVSASALESSALVNLTNLNLGWPIVRCRARPDGILMLVSTSPINRGAIGEALPKLLERDANWVNVNNVRMDLRVPVEVRGRCRIGDGEWVLGNVLNLGTGGCFFTATRQSPLIRKSKSSSETSVVTLSCSPDAFHGPHCGSFRPGYQVLE